MKRNNSFLKYISIGFWSVKEVFMYPANLLGRLAIYIIRILAFGWIYQSLFKINPSVSEITAVDAVWSLSFVQLVYQSSGHVFNEFQNDVKSGNIATQINKPYNFLYSKYAKLFISGIFKFIIFSIATVIVLIPVFGVPDITFTMILAVIILCLLGVMLNILVECCIGMLAFWIEETGPVYQVFSRLAWLFNGTFVPVAILPEWMKIFSLIYPLGIPFVVGRIFEDSFNTVFIIVILLLWIILFFVINNLMFKNANKRIAIHGG